MNLQARILSDKENDLISCIRSLNSHQLFVIARSFCSGAYHELDNLEVDSKLFDLYVLTCKDFSKHLGNLWKEKENIECEDYSS